MKNRTFYILLVTCLISSCGIKRKAYLAGYDIWHQGSEKKGKGQCSNITHDNKKHSFRSAVCSIGRSTSLLSEAAIPIVSDRPVMSTRAINSSLSCSTTRQHQTTKSVYRKRILGPQPASAQKHKLSVSQINTMAMVSLLFILLLIAGFIIPAGIGLPLVIASVIIGPLLAIIALTAGNKRRGVWVPGIAGGFWLVVLLYLALALFVF